MAFIPTFAATDALGNNAPLEIQSLSGSCPQFAERLAGLPTAPLDPTGTTVSTTDQIVTLADLPAIPAEEVPPLLDLLTCNLTGQTIAYGAAEIVIPAVNGFNEGYAHRETGYDYVGVSTDVLGRLSVVTEEANEEDLGTDNPVGGCNQNNKNVSSVRVNGEFVYRTNLAIERPAELSVADARAGLKSGFDIILTSRNDCGLGDIMSLTARLEADTVTRPGYNDGINVMGFRQRDNANAFASLYSSNGIRTGADVGVNSTDSNFVNTITPACRHSRHLPSTMAHEVGHIYGINHPVGGDSLTMWGSGGRCREHRSTLGWGDWLALEQRY